MAAAIDEYFDSFDAFKKQFGEAAKSIQGSGWGALVYDPIGGRLNTLAFYDQQNNMPVGSVPLLLLDMWEHAFYHLQYKNVKADYVRLSGTSSIGTTWPSASPTPPSKLLRSK